MEHRRNNPNNFKCRVGTYWIKLKTGDCEATQTVKIYASDQPVISNVDISNTTVTIYVNGGTAPYHYSTDGIKWQDSNEFNNIPRGDNHIFVKMHTTAILLTSIL